jgi:hypothetical protein
MIFIRFALVNYSTIPNDELIASCITFGEHTLNISTTTSKELYLFQVQTPISSIEFDNENYVVIPTQIRHNSEKIIEFFSNSISVLKNCSRTISSPSPCVAFATDDKIILDKLFVSNGIREQIKGKQDKAELNFGLIENLSYLLDRPDGCALLSSANCISHSIGKYKELIRLFERGFKLSGSKLIDPLYDFLSKNEAFNFSKEEVKNFTYDLRNPAVHAGKNDFFILEADINPIISRVELAAYDVLLNKKHWRSQAILRRDVWNPACFLKDNNHLVITKGKEATFQIKVTDPFDVYPLHLNGILDQNNFKNYWFPKN